MRRCTAVVRTGTLSPEERTSSVVDGAFMTTAFAALAVGVPWVGYHVLGMTGLVIGGAIGVPLAAIALYTGGATYCTYQGRSQCT